MLKKSIAAASIVALATIGLAQPAHAAASRAELALRWAPIHYQDVDATGSHALGGKSDYITRVDYDGDLVGRNNWDNAAGSTWTGGRETVDGTLQTQSSPHDSFQHPVTAQEVQGHGLKAWPQYDINGDGIVYYPSATVSETPSSGNDRDVRYQLIDMFASGGLWAQRSNASLFVNLGTFAGDDSGDCGVGTWDCTTDSANAPWGWDDGNDVPARGEIATDPAKLSAEYFTVPGTLSRSYTYNPYSGAAAALKEAAKTAPKVVD
jgi:hypothetical protein